MANKENTTIPETPKEPMVAIRQSVYTQVHKDLSDARQDLRVAGKILLKYKTQNNELIKENGTLKTEKSDAITAKETAERERNQMKKFLIDFENGHIRVAIRLILNVIARKLHLQKR